MSEINRGLDHMANLQRGWSPGQAMLPPDPDGLNRALDRAAAEHLREVAPHLAPREETTCGCVHDSPDFVPDAQRALEAHGHERLNRHARLDISDVEAINSVRRMAERAPAPPQPEPAICRHCAAGGCAPAPPAEAKGEMSEEGFEAVLSDLVYSARAAGARFCAGDNGRGNELLQIVQAKETKLIAHDAALRTRAREAEERAERVERELDEAQEELDDTGNRVWDEVLAAVRNAWGEDRPYNDSPCELIAKIIDERDEAREQRDDLANEILAERSDLAAAICQVAEACRERDLFERERDEAREQLAKERERRA